jgi:hypothetical protein
MAGRRPRQAGLKRLSRLRDNGTGTLLGRCLWRRRRLNRHLWCGHLAHVCRRHIRHEPEPAPIAVGFVGRVQVAQKPVSDVLRGTNTAALILEAMAPRVCRPLARLSDHQVAVAIGSEAPSQGVSGRATANVLPAKSAATGVQWPYLIARRRSAGLPHSLVPRRLPPS